MIVRTWFPRQGHNRILVVGEPFRVFVHHVYDDDILRLNFEGWPMVYCPKYLEPEHPAARDNCYICWLSQERKNRDLRPMGRYFFPIYDLSVSNPEELGMLWWPAGMRATELVGRTLPAYGAIDVCKIGVGLRTDYSPAAITRAAYRKLPLSVRKLHEIDPGIPDLPFFSESQMAKLFFEPYSLDYPRGVADADE